MATRNVSRATNAPLTICPGCHSAFKAPLLLPCCHTVCLECVEVTNAGMSRCPKCQSETETQPASLPRDVITERVVSVESVRSALEEKGSVLCAECEEDVSSAEYFCLVCTKPICELDFKLHKRMYKDAHQVINIEEVKLRSLEQLYPLQDSFKCTFHSDTVASKFCKTCHVFLCAYCLSHHHPDHPTISGEDFRQEVSVLSQQNRDKFEELDNEDYSSADNFLKKISLLRVEVEAQFEDIRRVLEERREQLIRKLDILHKDTLRLIQKEERRKEHVKDLIEKSKAYEHLPIDETLLINQDSINCKVTELLGQPPSRSKYRDIEFLMTQDVKCLLMALGCFKLEYIHDIMPNYAIGTRAPHSHHKFAPFAITKGDNDLLYNLTDLCEVVVMDRFGTVVRSFQIPHLKNISMSFCFIHWNKGLLYIVVGKKQSVTVCTEEGMSIKMFGSGGTGQGQFHTPLSVAVSNRNADIYVLENGNNRVQVFNSQYKFCRFIGNATCSPGELMDPIELALTPRDEVVVAHNYNPCINMYNSFGALLKQFGSSSLRGHFCQISAMCITPMGQVILSDLNQKQMIVYDPDLTTVWTVGRRGTGRGEYSDQFGIASLNDGTVYVCDKGNQRILVYERNSLFLSCN